MRQLISYDFAFNDGVTSRQDPDWPTNSTNHQPKGPGQTNP